MKSKKLKRLKRNPEIYETIELYTSVGRSHGYQLDNPKHLDEFIELIRASIKTSLKKDNLLHGKRIESLFAYVAGALGRCKMVKQEDSGEIFSANSEIRPPDYCVVLKNGSRFFIEVKNCNHKNSEKALSLKKSYISALKKYAQINNGRLKFAIYFSSFNQWVLLPIEHFDKQQNSYCINLTKALIKNEMGTVLGDTLVGTTPPLKIEFITNPIEKKSTNGRRQLFFTIDEIKLYCADVEIIDELEKEIAFYLIRYGDWLESDSYTVDKNNNLLSVVFEYSPVDPNYEQGFDIIGSLSSMISSAYSELTVHNQKVSALDVELNPSALLVEIPEDYKGRYMPLWRILPKANPYF